MKSRGEGVLETKIEGSKGRERGVDVGNFDYTYNTTIVRASSYTYRATPTSSHNESTSSANIAHLMSKLYVYTSPSHTHTTELLFEINIDGQILNMGKWENGSVQNTSGMRNDVNHPRVEAIPRARYHRLIRNHSHRYHSAIMLGRDRNSWLRIAQEIC